jgi:hypothetical protein
MLTLDKIQVPTETPMFHERKATEAGIAFLRAHGGRDNLFRVMAQMYIADRRLIAQFGRGMTDDTFVAIEGILAAPNGLLNHAAKTSPFTSIWHRHISEGIEMRVLADFEPSVLSAKERQVVEAVARDFAALDDILFLKTLADEAPEIESIGRGRFTLKDVLMALGDDPEQATEVSDDWESERRTRYRSEPS